MCGRNASRFETVPRSSYGSGSFFALLFPFCHIWLCSLSSAQCLCAKQSSRRSLKWKSLSLSLCKQELMQLCLEVDLGSANRLPLPPPLPWKYLIRTKSGKLTGHCVFFCLVIYVTRFTISWKLWFRDYSIRLPKEAENIIRRTLIHCKSISSRKCLI